MAVIICMLAMDLSFIILETTTNGPTISHRLQRRGSGGGGATGDPLTDDGRHESAECLMMRDAEVGH